MSLKEEEAPEHPLVVTWRYIEKAVCVSQEKNTHCSTELASTLILDFSASRTIRNTSFYLSLLTYFFFFFDRTNGLIQLTEYYMIQS